tara:strand:- start:990 stop:1169 length:180 start_codon:yes stop_codon:yes gene_type:complete
MNATDRKEAYADAALTGRVMTATARRTLSGDALDVALAEANAHVEARMDHIDGLFQVAA